MLARIRLYLPFVRNSFLAMLAYRLRYVTGILTYLVFVSVHYFIWKAVFAETGNEINGFTFPEMVTYLVIGWVSRSLYYSDIDDEIDDMVRSGQIATYLLRPVDFQLVMLANALGGCVFRAALFTLPLGIVILSIFPVLPPANISALLSFAVATFLAFLVLAEINFLVGLLAFSLRSIQGILRAKYVLLQFLSGLLLPFAFFPPWCQRIMEVMPFKAIASLPLSCYLGHLSGSALVTAFVIQLSWVVALFVLGAWGWRRAFTKLTIQGG